MQRAFLVALVSFLLWSPANSQSPDDQPEPSRDISVFMSAGVLEFVSAGFLIRLSDQYSLGLVTSQVVLRGRWFIFPHAAPGFGVRGAYYFSRDGRNKFLWANAITADLQYLLPTRNGRLISMHNPGGIGLEAVVGRDGLVGEGIGILWGAGVAASFYSENPPLLSIAFRLGIHLDF